MFGFAKTVSAFQETKASLLARMNVSLDIVARMRRAELKLHNRRPVKAGGGRGRDDDDDYDTIGDDYNLKFDGEGDGDDDSGASGSDEESRPRKASKKKKKAPKPSPYGPRWTDQEVRNRGLVLYWNQWQCVGLCTPACVAAVTIEVVWL